MFVVQGAKSFELWTGKQMDTKLMQDELSKVIK